MLPYASCIGCGNCVLCCSADCIHMRPDPHGFLYPQTDAARCTGCGRCEQVCPVLRSTGEVRDKMPPAYAAYIRDRKIQLQSSSGGIFSALAAYVLQRGGTVCGAALDSSLRVKHDMADTSEALGKFQGSKYVQSNLGDSFTVIRSYLEKGRDVLFSGTPCQVTALHAFLGRPYTELITVDIICHGVPSPKAWETYLRWQGSVYGANAVSASFRDKRLGWKQSSVALGFDDGQEYSMPIYQDAFMRAFLKNLCLRDVCYNCEFKTKTRCSDLTLGDFWGIEDILPEFKSFSGVSLVILQSDKGRQLWDSIAKDCEIHAVDGETSITHNEAMIYSCPRHPAELYFWEHLDTMDFGKLVDYCLYRKK